MADSEGGGKRGRGGRGRGGDAESRGGGRGRGRGRGDGESRGRGDGGYRGRGDGEYRGRGRGDGEFRGRGDGEYRGRGRGDGEFRGRGDGEYRGRGRGDGGYRGRGDGEYRGRGDGEYRGRGRGDGGYRGRGDGEYRGRGDGGYRGRGDRGDAGGFRGSFGGRGGRGGGRGGRREDDIGKDLAFSVDNHDIKPDAEITALEDQIAVAQKSSLTTLTSKMSKLDASKSNALTERFPARPAFGSKGKGIIVWANYFQVQVKPSLFYKYTMAVTQIKHEVKNTDKGKSSREAKGPAREVKGRKLHLVIQQALNQLAASDKNVVFATEFKSQLVALKKLTLKENPILVQVPYGSDSQIIDRFQVTINGPVEASTGDMKKYLTSAEAPVSDQAFPLFAEVLDAFNVVLGYGPRSKLEEIAAVGSSRFFPFSDKKTVEDLFSSGRALIAARGFFQSVRLGTGRVMLNTNVTHGVFKVSGPLTQIFENFGIMAVAKSNFQGMRRLRTMAKFMPKTRVRVTFKLSDGKEVRRTKAIHSLANVSDARRSKKSDHPPKFDADWEYPGPKNLQFYLDGPGGGKYTTVFDYFKQKYNVTLGNYPLLNLGQADKPTFFPAEVVEIIQGQTAKAKLTGDETTTMLDFACRSPYANAVSITTDARSVLGLDDENLGKFGISVDKSLLTVHARVLNPPQVSYLSAQNNKPRDVMPRFGSWNMRDVRVFKPGKMIERWSWVSINVGGYMDEAAVSDKVTEFAAFMSGNMGIRINKTPIEPTSRVISYDDVMHRAALEEKFAWAKENGIQYFLIILSNKAASEIYGKIKCLGDCAYGISTGCVIAKKFITGGPGYFANAGLKVNLKAGGVNHKLRDESGVLAGGKTMIVGYDVTHPTNMPIGPGTAPPSIVGLVANIDRELGQWPALAWEQPSKQEMLGDRLIEAFASRLKLWRKHNSGQLPDSIVIFRDGVSEGQFSQVLEKELPSIREACRTTYPAKQTPKISIIVSVKRHQTRFYPTSKEDMTRSGNIQSGTVVDRGVTQARYWDFFLTAHDALKGTARPAHYTVLLDEIFRAKFKDGAANELEKLTHELCYTFGRATKAVSICPPAYYADIVCERARAHRPEWFEVSDMESVSTKSHAATSAATGGLQVHEALQDTMYYI